MFRLGTYRYVKELVAIMVEADLQALNYSSADGTHDRKDLATTRQQTGNHF